MSTLWSDVDSALLWTWTTACTLKRKITTTEKYRKYFLQEECADFSVTCSVSVFKFYCILYMCCHCIPTENDKRWAAMDKTLTYESLCHFQIVSHSLHPNLYFLSWDEDNKKLFHLKSAHHHCAKQSIGAFYVWAFLKIHFCQVGFKLGHGFVFTNSSTEFTFSQLYWQHCSSYRNRNYFFVPCSRLIHCTFRWLYYFALLSVNSNSVFRYSNPQYFFSSSFRVMCNVKGQLLFFVF